MTVTLLRPYRDALPRVKPGDVALLRDIRIQSYQHELSGISTDSSRWVIWRIEDDEFEDMRIISANGPEAEYGEQERSYARSLWDWWNGIDEDIRRFMAKRIDEESALAQVAP
jgi:hypothetical protein